MAKVFEGFLMLMQKSSLLDNAQHSPTDGAAPEPQDPIWSERMKPTLRSPDDHRSPYQTDYSRVIHSASFRRLQGKMQILADSDGDFHRTRMTHSLEVAQIGAGIVQHLRATDHRPDVQNALPEHALIETICLVHDLGHPPFGHAGESALNQVLRNNGGFEGNGQTLRILSKLEIFSQNNGSNLTRRTLLGTIKYPVPYSAVCGEPAEWINSPITGQPMLSEKHHSPPKCYLDTEQDVVEWIYAPFSDEEKELIVTSRAKSFDSSIMDLADDTSYAIHDFEDAIMLGLVTPKQMIADIEPGLWCDFFDYLDSRDDAANRSIFGSRYDAFAGDLFSDDPIMTKRLIGRLVSYMLANTYVRVRDEFQSDLYRLHATLQPNALRLIKALKHFIMERVIRSPQLRQIRFKGQNMIIQLFSYFDHDPRLMPTQIYEQYRKAEGEDAQRRVIGDYIASMTDASLVRVYERLISPRAGSSFDNL